MNKKRLKDLEDGAVMMFTSIQDEEMRQYCSKCPPVRYVPKKALQTFSTV